MAQQVASQFSPTDEWSGALATLSQSLWLQLEHFLRPPPHALSTHFSKARPVVPRLSADEDSGGSGSLDQTLDEVEVAFSAHPSWQAPQEGAEEGAEELDRVVQDVTQRIGRTDPQMATTHFSKARPVVPRHSADEDSGGSGSLDETLDEVEVAFSAHPSSQAPQEGAEEGAEELDRVVQEVSQRIGRTAQDTEPILTLLKANWYNTVDSLALASLGELVNLGVPSRFASELLFEVSITFRGEVPAKRSPGNLRGRNTPQLGKRKYQSSWDGRDARQYIEFLSRSLVLTLRYTSRERLPSPDSDGFYDVGEVLRRVKYPPEFRRRPINLAQFNILARGRDRSGHKRLIFCNLDEKGVDLEMVRVKLGKPHKHRHHS